MVDGNHCVEPKSSGADSNVLPADTIIRRE
jgi:hypothetical protein